MGVLDTTYTFQATDTITSSKLNNIIDQATFTGDAIQGTTLQVVSPGKLAVSAGGITSNELASNSVTTAKLTSEITNSLVPSGAVMAFAMNGAPTGWLAANGSAVSRTTYSALWTALGTTSSPYGQGDGSTTFNLPDLRGYFVRGSGTNSDNTASGTFGAKQADDFKAHTHNTIQTIDQNGGFDSGAGRARYGGSATASSSAGGTETRPKNIAMLYCIKI